jgi:hypothetical protein
VLVTALTWNVCRFPTIADIRSSAPGALCAARLKNALFCAVKRKFLPISPNYLIPSNIGFSQSEGIPSRNCYSGNRGKRGPEILNFNLEILKPAEP